MNDHNLSAEDEALLAKMKADEQRLIDSGAPPSTLSRGKQEFGIGMNADGTLNLVDPATPRPDRRGRGGPQPTPADRSDGEDGPDPGEPDDSEH